MQTRTNRPWASTITKACSTHNLDQVHKLARNYIASLDLGCGNLRMVDEVDKDVFIRKMNGKERYLEWVRNWKLFYKELSVLIRHMKTQLIPSNPELLRLKETAQVMLNARHNAKLASWSIKMRQSRVNVK